MVQDFTALLTLDAETFVCISRARFELVSDVDNVFGLFLREPWRFKGSSAFVAN